MKHNIKGVIFDQDGTLFDTEQLYVKSWIEAGRFLGFSVPEEFCQAVSGTSGQKTIDVIQDFFPDIDAEALKDLTFRLCVEKQEHSLEEKPGLHEILEYCEKQGWTMAVASSSPKSQIEKNLKKAGIASYFSDIISGELIEHGKPAPDIFFKASESLGFQPEECYVFEDSFNGVKAGYHAGCHTIMIPDQVAPTEEIKALYETCCETFFDAITYLEQVTK